MEETLTRHRLGLTPILKVSFRTTNCIENVNSLLEQLTQRTALGQGLPPSADATASDTSRARHQTARDDGLTYSPEPVLCLNYQQNSQTLYAGTGRGFSEGGPGGVHRSEDGGDTWTLVGVTDEFISILAIEPRNSQRLSPRPKTGV